MITTVQKDPNSLARTRTLSELSGNDYSTTDFGVGKGLAATASSAVQRNFTFTALDWVDQYDEQRDMKMGMYEPVTQEEFDSSPARKYGLSFRNDENPHGFQRRVQRAAKLKYNDELASGQNHQALQLVTAIGTGLVTDPTNLVGFGAGASVMKGALYANAGRRTAAAYHSAKGSFKQVLAYGAGFEVPYAFMTDDLGVEEYTFDHLKTAAGMNLAFAGVLGTVSGGLAARRASKVNKYKADYKVFTEFMEGDAPIGSQYSNLYATGNKAIVKAIKNNKRLLDIAEGRVAEDKITLSDMFEMTAMLSMHESHLVTSNLSSKMADSYLTEISTGNVGIRKATSEYKARVKRVNNAVLKGKGVDKLSEADVQFLKDNDIEIRNQYDPEDAGGNQLKRSRVLTKDYGIVTNSEAVANQALMTASLKARKLESAVFEARKQGDKAQAEKLNIELETAKKEVDGLIGNTYANIVKDASEMVNNVLFGEDNKVPVQISKQPDSTTSYAWKVDGDLKNYISEAHTVFSDAFNQNQIPATEALHTRVLSALFHESWHNVAEINPKMYNRLLNIASEKNTKAALLSTLKERGYDKSYHWMAESPSHLLEFCLTRPEFWKVLQTDDKALYTKYTNLISKLLEYGANVLKLEGFDATLNVQSPGLLATRVGAVVSELRMATKVDAQLKNLYKTTSSQALENPKIHKKAAYENPNLQSRRKAAEAALINPVKFLEDTINRVIGSDDVLPQLTPSILPETAKELSAYQADIVKSLEDAGYGYLSPYVKDMLMNQMGSEKRRASVLKILRKGDASKSSLTKLLTTLKQKNAPLETAQRVGFIILDDTKTPAEKMGLVNNYFHEENLAMILRYVHNGSVSNKLTGILNSKKTPAAKMRQLKTMLDGSLRKGVERNTSIQRLVDGQIIKDQSPLVEYLVNNDILELFLGEDVTKYMSSYKNAKSTRAESFGYGSDLKKASLSFHMDLMDAISSGETPVKWKNVPVFENFVELVKTVNLGQLAEINNLGVNMRQKKGFTGYSMKYDRQVVSSMTEAQFVTFMLSVVDVDQTTNLHGGIMEGFGDPNLIAAEKAKGRSNSVDFQPFEINSFLKSFYKEIISGKFEEPEAGTKSIVGSMRKAAKIAFKAEGRNEAMVKLTNFENLGRLLLEQVRNRSEKIALVKELGHDPYNMVMGVANKNGMKNQKGYSILDATAKQVTGLLDNPVDVNISQNFQKIRQFSNVVFLAGSGMSALSDIPLMLTTLQYLGEGATFKDFVASYKQAAGAHFRGNNKEISAWFRSQGAGLDIITRQTAQRVVTGESIDGGRLAFANQLMFELNGLNRVTATHQMVFLDLLTNSLGEQLRSGKINSTLKARMLEFGFTEKEITALGKFVEKAPDGKYRLGSSSVSNAPLQRKVSGFLTTYMKEAVIEPDAGAQAITRLGLESGTVTGESARVALQYSSFMLGMSRVVYNRFMHGYEGEGSHNAHKMSHLVAYVGTALAFAYMTTVLKDLSKFKEPIDPLDMTFFDFTRVLRQSGVLGITELGLNAAQFGPTATLSPIAGMATDVLSGDVAKGLKPLTGQQFPVIGPVIQKAIGFVMGETVQEMQNDMTQTLVNKSD